MNRRILILSFIILALIVGFFQIAVPICLHERAGCLGYPVTPPPPLTAPGKYRILWPAIETLIAPTVGQSDPNILLVDTLLEVVCIVITIPALYAWLKRWMNVDRTMIGVIVFATINLVAYHWFFRGGGIPIEAALVCLALAWINRSWWLFIPLVVIGALNRETSLVIPAIYVAYHWRANWRQAVVLAVIWATITLALHVILGGAEHQTGGLTGTLEFNLGTLSNVLVTNLIFAPLAIAVVISYRSASPILKRFVWVAVVYLAAIAVGGALEESNRLVLPMLPLIIPLLLSSPASETSPSNSMFQHPPLSP